MKSSTGDIKRVWWQGRRQVSHAVRAASWSVQTTKLLLHVAEAGRSERGDHGVLILASLVALPPVVLDDAGDAPEMRMCHLGVQSVFAHIARELDDRKQAQGFRVVQCLRVPHGVSIMRDKVAVEMETTHVQRPRDDTPSIYTAYDNKVTAFLCLERGTLGGWFASVTRRT